MSVTLITYCIILTAFILLLQAEFYTCTKKSRGLQQVISEEGNVSLLNKKNFSCALLFGTVSIYWFLLNDNIRLLDTPVLINDRLNVLILLSVFAIITGYSAAKKIFPLHSSPVTVISLSASLSFILLRTLFLTVYEFFFRGILLFTMVQHMGEGMAVIVNVLLYVLAHGFSSRKEMTGAVPFGLLLCSITLLYQSVWPAVIIHLCLALSHDINILLNQKSPIKTIRL
ncbi:MAG: CPBP family intramembrane metalloprotease [Chitinophagaceae bacterium]|nr:MAG: CPBP family intramembrane metalloprotease [Chitinophagaceae bacterium]